jgi:hypothetical protein
MKNIFKVLSLLFVLNFSTGCIELAVGGAIAAGSSYVAEQGYVATHFDRSYDSCWQITEEFANTIDGKVVYHSHNQGKIKVEFTDKGVGIFTVEKVTNRATKVSLRVYRYNLPNNELAQMYFEALAEKLN